MKLKIFDPIVNLLFFLVTRFLFRYYKYSSVPENVISSFEYASGGKMHYSQLGEDVLLMNEMSENMGFFVDIGAHHPTRFSNTYSLYRRGWRGINIDINPNSKKIFDLIRPEDINLEICISNNKEPIIYNIYSDPAFNTVSKERVDELQSLGIIPIKEIETIPEKLSDILDHYLPENKSIDVMNIDVEGYEMDVLKSNNWVKYSPNLIIVEVHRLSLESIHQDPVIIFLKNLGYIPTNKFGVSIILQKMSNM